MKNLFRSLLPQWVINYFYHLPMAILANWFYDSSTRGLTVIGVTGTDGKTTTVNMIYQILKRAGKKVSMISTINAPGFHVTSPDPFMVQKFARDAVDNGDEYLVLEVTSHALDQYRFWGVKFDIGVITNITHEHLDYHKTFKNYKNTKLKLIKDAKFAIVNGGIKGIRGEILTFGLDRGNFNQKEEKLKLKVPGDYNLENALAALAVAFILSLPKEITKITLEKFEGLIGRMQEIKNHVLLRNKGVKIFIDFAHTPNGLEQALKSLRSPRQRRGKLISLIGCEGYRDVGKRSMMGEIAQKLSDITIVTAVDPRGQQEIINNQIMKGAKKAGAKKGLNFYVINDRQEAINFAIKRLAKKGDTVALFGKGHEKSMNMDGKKELPWSDEKAVQKALNG